MASISKLLVISTSTLLLGLLSLSVEEGFYVSPVAAQEILSNLIYFEADGVQEIRLLELRGLSNRTSVVVLRVVSTTSRDLYDWSEAGNQRNCSISTYTQAGELQVRWEMLNCSVSSYVGPTFTEPAVEPYDILEIQHEGVQRFEGNP